MNKKKRFICILLAGLMTFSVTACKKSDDNSSSEEYEYEYEYEYVSGNSSDQGTTSSVSSGTGNQTSSTSGAGTATQTGVNPSKYRGTTVRYATWKDPALNEDGPVVKAFEKKYGITVKVDLMGQSDYINTITGMIASGDAPDVYFCNNDFPGALSCLQPIDAAQLDLRDSIWDQGMINVSTINGKTYLVNTVGNIWNEVDCVFYNKKLLKDNNITTPEEYYNAGKWNFDAMTKVMTEVKALGSGYIGGYIDWESLVGSTGAGFYKWENGKFSNGMDTMLTDVMRYLSTCLKNGLIRGITNYSFRDDFINGKCGLAITNAYGLKKTGYWRNMNTDTIGFTYIPNYDSSHNAVTTGLYRGWGIIKSAKNPVAAGIFLRYYLDVNNYNTSAAFISSEAESFFFKLTSGITTDQKNFYMLDGAKSITGTPRASFAEIAMNDPSQVSAVMSAKNNAINSDVKLLNDFVAKQTK